MHKTEGTENRNHFRIEKPLVVKFNYLGSDGWKSIFGACHNISEDGASIKVNLTDNYNFQSNDNINIAIFLSEWENKIDVVAHIIWVKKYTDPSPLLELGLKFLYISKNDQEKLSNFIYDALLKKYLK